MVDPSPCGGDYGEEALHRPARITSYALLGAPVNPDLPWYLLGTREGVSGREPSRADLA
jgi:hypothetical protein